MFTKALLIGVGAAMTLNLQESTCSSTDYGAADRDGDTCENYEGNSDWCGGYDTDAF